MTSLIVIVGGAGGALNAALSGDAGFLPRLVTLSPGGARVLRVGILGNIVLGCGAVVGLSWALQAGGFSLNVANGPGLPLLACGEFFIAFVSSRWVTNEADILLLRTAVFKAASAPAAHPDTVGEMQYAPPYKLYTLVDSLLPRRAGHR